MIRRFFLLIVTLFSFLYSSDLKVISSANKLKLYEKNEWKSLLHFKDELNIKDNNFILSINNFSLKNEMEQTIQGFFEPQSNYENVNQHFQCKFPARFLFIKKELDLKDDIFPKIDCFEFEEYKKKAPSDKIYMVYASENVKNPSSMMGHTFLKFEGKNEQNEIKAHSISFYTTINTINLFELFYENFISGMEGTFVLRPYKETLDRYIKDEKRNVWEYELNLNSYQQKLLSYHIWELKDVDMKYFFTKYNCSTVLFYTLSLVNPKIYNDEKLWVTPLDITKYLYKYDLIKSSQLIASDGWMNRMLKENFDQNNTEIKSGYYDISAYKSPNKIPDERQIRFSYKKVDDEKYAKISFLPASHLLSDDNREYFGESELKIAYLSLLANENKLSIDEFTLYGMKSLLPYQSLAKDLSYEFEMTFKKDFDTKMNYVNNTRIDGGVGYDFKLSYDMDIYFLLNTGLNHNKEDKLKLIANPKMGLIIYEILNMKSILNYEKFYLETNRVYDKYSLSQDIFFSKNKKIYFDLQRYESEKDKTNLEIGVSFNF